MPRSPPSFPVPLQSNTALTRQKCVWEKTIRVREAIKSQMNPIPLPSHIHYELLLQLLERQTLSAVSQQPDRRAQVNQLIITLRKAFAQQKQLETHCQQTHVEIEYRWFLDAPPPRESDSR